MGKDDTYKTLPASDSQTESSADVAASPQIDDAQTSSLSEKEPDTVAATESTIKPPRKKRKLLLLVLISIAVLLGALALCYVYWFQNPNKVVADGLNHALSAESLTYTGTVTTVGSTKMNVAINGSGSSEGGTLNAKFSFDARNKKYTLDGNALVDKNSDVYIKVKNIDELADNYRSAIPSTSKVLFDQIIDKVNDKWVKISADDLKSYNPGLATAQKCTADAFRKFQGDRSVKSELTSVYKTHPFIKVEKTLGAKGGSLGYELGRDDVAAKAFVKEYKNTALYKSLQKCNNSFVVNDNEPIGGKLNDKTKVEVWIDRWSHQITRMTVKDESSKDPVNISIEPKFNHSVKVSTPEDATTIEQLQKDVMSLIQAAQQPPMTESATD